MEKVEIPVDKVTICRYECGNVELVIWSEVFNHNHAWIDTTEFDEFRSADDEIKEVFRKLKEEQSE